MLKIESTGISSTSGGLAIQHEEPNGGRSRPQRASTFKHSVQIWGWTVSNGAKFPGNIKN